MHYIFNIIEIDSDLSASISKGASADCEGRIIFLHKLSLGRDVNEGHLFGDTRKLIGWFGIQHERVAFGSPRPIPLLDEGHESIRGSPIATC